MSQAETLQNIFSEIADIKDALCAGIDATASEVNTQVLNEFSINPDTWEYSPLSLENATSAAPVALAQTEINELIGLTLGIAKTERLSTDPTLTLASGEIVPIATGSPIMLLPKLLKALVQFKAPLSVVTKVITEILSDLLLEHIKRKLNEKNCKITAYESVGKSKLFLIPETATHLITSISGLPDWVGKDFIDQDLNLSLVIPTGLQTVDIAKYSAASLPEVRFGFRQKNPIFRQFTHWQTPQSVEFLDQVFQIPEIEYANCERLVYVQSKITHSTDIAFVMPD